MALPIDVRNAMNNLVFYSTIEEGDKIIWKMTGKEIVKPYSFNRIIKYFTGDTIEGQVNQIQEEYVEINKCYHYMDKNAYYRRVFEINYKNSLEGIKKLYSTYLSEGRNIAELQVLIELIVHTISCFQENKHDVSPADLEEEE